MGSKVEFDTKTSEDFKRQLIDPEFFAPLGADRPEDPEDALDSKKRVNYLLQTQGIDYTDKRLVNLLFAQQIHGEHPTHKDLTVFLYDPELYEHTPVPAIIIEEEKWMEELDGITEKSLTKTEIETEKKRAKDKGKDITLREMVENKKRQYMKRKTHLWRMNLIYEAREMIDDGIWDKLEKQFENFTLDYGKGGIKTEVEDEFLSVWETNSPMFEFELGVGKNEGLEKIFKARRKWVDEARDRMSQIHFGSHFFYLKDDQKGAIKRILEGEECGETSEILRALRKASYYPVEMDDQGNVEEWDFIERVDRAEGLENEKWLWAKGRFREEDLMELDRSYHNLLDLRSGEEFKGRRFGELEVGEKNKIRELVPYDYRTQLNKRAEFMFGEGTKFVDLSGSEQKMVLAGTNEALSFKDIMRWIADYRVKNEQLKKAGLDGIRLRREDSPVNWVNYRWVSRVGLWRLVDVLREHTFFFLAQNDVRALQRGQIDDLEVYLGKYRKFDMDMAEMWFGKDLWQWEPENKGRKLKGDKELAEQVGAYKELWTGVEERVGYAGGLWQEWLEREEPRWKKYIEDKTAEAARTGEKFRLYSLEEYVLSKMRWKDYDTMARETYQNQWKLLAEKIYMQLRADWIKGEIARGSNPQSVEGQLDNDKVQNKLTEDGKRELMEFYNMESKAFLTNLWMLLWRPAERFINFVGLAERVGLKEETMSKKDFSQLKKQEWWESLGNIGKEVLLFLGAKPLGKEQRTIPGWGSWLTVRLGGIQIVFNGVNALVRTMYNTLPGLEATGAPVLTTGLPWYWWGGLSAVLTTTGPFLARQAVVVRALAARSQFADAEADAQMYIKALSSNRVREKLETAYMRKQPVGAKEITLIRSIANEIKE